MNGWLDGLFARGDSAEPPEGEELKLVWPVLEAAANQFLQCFGESFTQLPNGHIETDIAAAASMAGVALREGAGVGVVGQPAGTNADWQQGQAHLVRFMIWVARDTGLRVTGWNGEVPIEHHPLMSIPEMVAASREPFARACKVHGVPKKHHPHVAALTAMKLVGGGNEVGALHESVGTSLALHYFLNAAAGQADRASARPS